MSAVLLISIEGTTKPIAANIQKLWFDVPAQYFINALPIGNGRLGAMVYGKTKDETFNLNESTLWTGGAGGAQS
jgi:alpha-L-fucosidase 2